MNKNNVVNTPTIHKTLVTLCKKRKSTKSFKFHILRWTSFLLIPVISLSDEFSRSAKIDWAKKPIWVYSSSNLWRGSEQKFFGELSFS